jgi:ankyrin repeat protein
MKRNSVSDADAFAIAVAMGDPVIVRSAIAAGVDVNGVGQKGVPPIVLSAAKGQEEILDLSLGAGADVNQADRNGGMTALHAATALGREELVRKLIARGANLDASFGRPPTTALSIAFRKGFKNIARCLLESGADPNVSIETPSDPPEQQGVTPLIYAASAGDMEMLRALVDHKADLNFPKADGLTPLMVAAFSGQAQAVKLLVEGGADINVTHSLNPSKKFNALDLAAAKGHRQVVEYLSLQGATPSSGDRRRHAK